VEQVSQFRYLGSLIVDGYCTKEMRNRIEMAKKVYGEKENVHR